MLMLFVAVVLEKVVALICTPHHLLRHQPAIYDSAEDCGMDASPKKNKGEATTSKKKSNNDDNNNSGGNNQQKRVVDVDADADDRENKQQPTMLINDPKTVVDDALLGLVRSSPHLRLLQGSPRVVIRADIDEYKMHHVTLISGGGSGHEPSHAGYVGPGMLSAAVCGDVFASPPSHTILNAILACAGPRGVLVIVKNYTGDRLNFGLAVERAKAQGVKVDMVIVADDCSLPRSKSKVGRRGLAGTVFYHKILGGMADFGVSLEGILNVASHLQTRIGTVGVALSPCSVPGVGLSFHLKQGTCGVGVGIHGEEGAYTSNFQSAHLLVKDMLARLLSQDEDYGYLDAGSGKQFALMVNNLGGTSMLEMQVAMNEAVVQLESSYNIVVTRSYMGTFMTSTSMSGISISLLDMGTQEPNDVAWELWLDAETDVAACARLAPVKHSAPSPSQATEEEPARSDAEESEEGGDDDDDDDDDYEEIEWDEYLQENFPDYTRLSRGPLEPCMGAVSYVNSNALAPLAEDIRNTYIRHLPEIASLDVSKEQFVKVMMAVGHRTNFVASARYPTLSPEVGALLRQLARPENKSSAYEEFSEAQWKALKSKVHKFVSTNAKVASMLRTMRRYYRLSKRRASSVCGDQQQHFHVAAVSSMPLSPLMPTPQPKSHQHDATITGFVSLAIERCCKVLVDNEATLTQIDMIVGDGDCGLSMASGANHVLSHHKQQKLALHDLSMLASQLSSLVEVSMGGTSGGIYSIFFTSVSHTLTTLDQSLKAGTLSVLGGLKASLEAGIASIQRYGGATEGDRTLLDVLIPLKRDLDQVTKAQLTSVEWMELSARLHQFAAKTSSLCASVGRSSYVPADVTQGHPDPGAVAVALWMSELFLVFSEHA